VQLVTGDRLLAASALYGAAVVALPGALMARGATSRLATITPLTSTVSMMFWATVKIVVSIVMLALAARIVPGLHWPVMLATLVVCMQTYAFALLWRGRGRR
jgi:ATP synthase protein I